VLGVSLVFVKLLVLHEHDRDCQIEQEERTYYHTHDEVHLHEPSCIRVFVNVHDLGPALHSDALEDSEEGACNIVKVGDAVVQLVDVCIKV